MIQNIIFDMGNVLRRYDPDYIVRHMPIQPQHRSVLCRQVFQASEWSRLDDGTITNEEFWEAVKRRVPETAYEDAWTALATWHQYMPPVPGMLHLEKELVANGYRLLLLSNASKVFETYAEAMPELRIIPERYFSATYGVVKPQEAFYRLLLERSGVRPESCLFIDDMEPNVRGARRCGIKAVQFAQDIGKLRQALHDHGIAVETDFQMTEVRDEADFRRLSQVADEVWHEHFASILSPEQIDYMVEKFQSYEAMKCQVAQEGYRYYFITEQGKEGTPEIRGYIGFRVDDEAVFLSKLYILKAYRGRGLASRALEFLISMTQSYERSKLWLTVNRFNTNTIDIYRHWGFQTVRSACTDIGNGFVMDDYIMELPVKEVGK